LDEKKIAAEFLWLLFTLLFSLPLGLVFLWLLGFTSETPTTERTKDYIVFLYIVGYLVSFVGVYLIRIIIMAIKTLTNKEEEV
jgi:hypothetical protein